MNRRFLFPCELSIDEETSPALQSFVEELDPGTIEKIYLLHVVQEIYGTEPDELSEFYGTLERTALAALKEREARLEELGFSSESHVVLGDRAKEVLRFAAENSVNLIVMLSHRMEPAAISTSSLSQMIAHFAPCSVILLRD